MDTAQPYIRHFHSFTTSKDLGSSLLFNTLLKFPSFSGKNSKIFHKVKKWKRIKITE
ncbi:hypothetical protein HMPREF3213_00262 [Heyndrickxia coagulans]|uniref:Uncharacterized protein n=1 Tax=Heyndrickxia coagulans TaxID=1398 RepID=A0A133L2C0_HEYCO|nr:hypothetical protein HMPREF3213_00262 [Heyndrickxia coagulans]